MNKTKKIKSPILNKLIMSALYILWVAFGFLAVQFLLAGMVWLVGFAWDYFNFPNIKTNDTIVTTLIAAFIYIFSLAVIILVPYKFFKLKTTRKELGLNQRWPNIRDFGLAPIAFISSLILSFILLIVTMKIFGDGFNVGQEQAILFDKNASYSYFSLLMIFITIVVMAPFAEELLIRGYLYGKLRAYNSASMTILLSSLLFGALHLGFGKLADLQWNVAINTFAVAIFMGWLREYTGSVWSGIIVHVIKNFIAFMVLFMLPFYFGHIFG